MELDKNQVSGHTTHPPQTHTRVVDPTPKFSSLALPKTCGDNVDYRPSSSIPSTNLKTPLPRRLHGLPAPSPLQSVPSSGQETRSREVSRCVIVLHHPFTRFILTILLPIQHVTDNPMESKHHHPPPFGFPQVRRYNSMDQLRTINPSHTYIIISC